MPALNHDSAFAVIICAAGSSSRMGGVKKEYCPLPGTDETVLARAVRTFAVFPGISVIAITVPDSPEAGEAAARRALPPDLLQSEQPKIIFVSGGKTRRASVHHALSALREYAPCYVLIHDGSRPWVSRELIMRVTDAARRYNAVVPLLPLVETPKETDAPLCAEQAGAVYIKRHLRRARVGGAQTPQAFAFPEILSAHEQAALKESREGYEYTDDAEVWGEFCGQVAAVPGALENRKITFPEDLKSTADTEKTKKGSAMQRVGLGSDTHRLVTGRRFLLAGVELPADRGELGHSDGDALAHAVCDAILGAAGLGDIGAFFPPADPAWKDADSMALLRSVFERVKNSGWRLVNLDCVVCCEKPKLLPYRDNIRYALARALEAPMENIFVKGKTAEGMGPVGEGIAVEATAVCLLERD